MEWSDVAIILSARPHGEHAAVVSVLTLNHGRWLGRVQGAQGAGKSGAKKSWLSAGTLVAGDWQARLDEQLGQFRFEPSRHSAAHVFDNHAALLAMDYVAALTDAAVPERMPLPLLYQALARCLDTLCQPAITPPQVAAQVVQYERQLLDMTGYGLDLSGCAVTGQVDDLVAISPHSGRAVSRAAAAPYGERLLVLPAYWMQGHSPAADELAQAFAVTGHFLRQHFFALPKNLPPQRQQILSVLQRAANVAAA